MLISYEEISVAIANLKKNKTSGIDGVQAEHFIHCSERIKCNVCLNSFLLKHCVFVAYYYERNELAIIGICKEQRD